MSFERTNTRYDVQPLRDDISDEMKLRLELEQRLRRNAEDDYRRRQRRLSARIGRVLSGIRRTLVSAWQTWRA